MAHLPAPPAPPVSPASRRAAAGVTALENPSLAASFIREAACDTGRTAPERPISPKKTESAGSGEPDSEETSAAAAARSGRRLGDLQPAGDVEVDVVHAELQARMGLEHRDHHGQPRRIPAHHRAPRRAERGGRDQRLDLDEERARALHPGEDGGAGRRHVPALEEHRRRITHFREALPGHLEDADLVGGAEAVLHRAQGCGNGARCRPRRRRPRRPCARRRAGRRSARPW